MRWGAFRAILGAMGDAARPRCGRCKDAVDGGVKALRSHWRASHPREWAKLQAWLAEHDAEVAIEERAGETDEPPPDDGGKAA